MSPLAIVQLIVVLIPLLTQLIQWIETLVNSSGVPATGAEKKDAVMTLFNQFWQSLSTSGAGDKIFQIPAEQMTTAVSQLIDFIVTGLNALGIFKTSTPVTPAPAPVA